MSRPVIFCAFANKKNDLESLKYESRTIRDNFSNLHDEKVLEFFDIANAIKDDIYKNLNRFRYRTLIFHYAGHATDRFLELEDKPNYAEGLAKLLSNQQQLFLVFLNACSTKKQISKLVAEGAKAIIATHYPVQDNLASEFAVQFYNSLIKGATLKVAFEDAQAFVLGDARGQNQVFQSFRGIEIDDLEEEEIFPWMLYVEEDHLLEWKLPKEKQDAGSIASPIQLVLENKIQQIEEKYVNLGEKTIELVNYQDQIQLLDPATQAVIITTFEGLMANTKKAIAEIEAEIKVMEEEIKADKKIFLTQENREQLQIKLKNLNYDAQFTFYSESVKLSEQDFGAFILQGTPACAPRFLIDRIMNKAEVKIGIKKIFKDFSALSLETVDEKDIWQTVAHHFNIGKDSPSEIVKEIFENDFLERQHIVFFFEHLNFTGIEDNIRIIEKFWFHLQALALQANIKNSAGNKILLFLSDINCSIQKNEDGEYISNKSAAYQAHFDDLDLVKKRTYILPIIQPLALEELKRWARELPDSLGLIEGELENILNKKNGFILPTIKAICQKTETEVEIYEEYFAKYEFKPQT